MGLVGLVALSALTPACAHEFDTQRPATERGSVGEEIYGVLCDRVGAQAFREDLSGDSFRNVCHRPKGGAFADKIDESKLPALDANARNDKGEAVSIEQQRAARDAAAGKLAALARRRTDLVRALDATLPAETKIPAKDVDNPDVSKSCDTLKSSRDVRLTDEIADMLGRMGELYNDGTLPHSTASLARVIDAFKGSDQAQAAWARISARQGYRPIETALGAMRPVIAYPHLRDLSNASLRLLSADSNPYELEPKIDAYGFRIPVPGPGNAALNKMLEAAHAELLATKAEPRPAPLGVTTDSAGREVISRPRENLEMIQTLMLTSDPAFGPSNAAASSIVRRDSRGYAAIAGGLVPAPFVDTDKDGLPDVDERGQFKTTDGSLAPSPFPYPGAPQVQRDELGRAVAGSQLLYEYVDTNHTFAAQLMSDLRPLLNPDPEAKHETLMDMLGGLHVAVGARAAASKSYPNGEKVDYQGISKDSPVLDLIYALGVVLGDRTSDSTLALGRELFATKTKEMARVTGAVSRGFDIAQAHPEASVPRTSTYWDENLETLGKIAREPGLLEDLLKALAAPETANLGNIFGRYANFKDEITYDKDLSRFATYNVTTKSNGELKTPVDRSQPQTGENRSALYRFLGLISDTTGVTMCNKPGAKAHFLDLTLPGSFEECAMFKIENLAAFYLDAMVNAQQYDDGVSRPKRGTIYLRPALLRNTPGIVGLLERSSGIYGMWEAGSQVAPTPEYLNRLVFFDIAGDTQNEKTKSFVVDLQGEWAGTSVCPERIIDDPDPNAFDRSPDGKIHGLRNCPNGQWLQQRRKNTIFTWEHFGFYEAMRPTLSAFVKHGREDLFLELANNTYKHWGNADASADECRLAGGKACARSGLITYEPLIAEAFVTDIFPALSELAKALEVLPIKRCDAIDPQTKACTKVTTVSGIEVAAASARAMLDPELAKANLQLTDRKGETIAKRNDGSAAGQVTPAHLLTSALGGIDLAFDAYEEQHPDDKERRASWRRARSQLIDQLMGVNGLNSNSSFANPSVPKMVPRVIDMMRAQLAAHCPRSFTPPYEKCTWAREELVKKAEETITGPLAAAGLDVMEAVRADKDGRVQMEVLMQYLLDAASKNDALANLLASSSDIVQILGDDENLVPLYHVLASAMNGSIKDENGRIKEKSLVDAQMALLARISGRAFDKEGKEMCKREIDPNQALAVMLGNLVTPINGESFKGQTPLEVIIDVIADVNRVDPTQTYEGTLARPDYKNISENIVDFLSNKERGLEQFYEVVRQGTKP